MRATRFVALSLLVVLSLALLLQGTLPSVTTGSWTPANNLVDARSGGAAALLQDGRVLFTGGTGSTGALASAELFNTDGSVTSAPPMQDARSNHAAVTLQDGRVLVVGGTTSGSGITNAAEIYNPASNSWTPVAGGMTAPRSNHTASLLKDGTVLIAGGQSTSGALNSLEIYDPATGAFLALTSGILSSARQDHAAAVAADGRVLIAGGSDGSTSLNSTDIFDPATGWVAAGPAMASARAGLSATTLLDGKVLLAGGNSGSADLSTTEVYDPSSSAISATGGLATPRRDHLALLLPHNNGVLIAGGSSAGAPLASAELFYPWTGASTATGAMASPRTAAAGAALKQDGYLLVAGGSDGTNSLASTELYGFATVKTDKADYAPGETVTISGSGWQPGETVTLSFVESPLLDTHGPFMATADSFGNISNTNFVPDAHDSNVLFFLTAKGSVSQAQATFTDANPNTIALGAQSPNPANAGASSTYQVTVTFNGNSTDSCTVDLTAAPSGSPAWPAPPAGGFFSFSPSSLASTGADQTSTLTITIPAAMAANTYNFTVTATPRVNTCQNNPKTLPASGTLVVVAPIATTLALSAPSPSSVPVGSAGPVTLSATLTRTTGGAAVNGATITFTVDGSSVGTGTTNISGVTTFSYNPSALAAGSHNIQASFAQSVISNVSYQGSTSGTQTLTVLAPPTIAKAFGAASIPLNSNTTLTFTLTNPNTGTDLTGVAFSDTFPTGLQVASTPGVVSNCAGTFTAAPGSGSVNLSGGTIAHVSNCTISVNVTAASTGTKNNTTTAISSTNGGTGATSNTATLTVTTRATTTTIAPATNTSPIAGTATLTVTVTDTDTGTKSTPTGTVSFTDTSSPANTDNITACTLAQSVVGTATCSVTVTPSAPAGAHTVNASFAANDSVHTNSSTASPATLTVTTRTTTTTITPATNTAPIGGTGQFTVTVKDTDSGTVSNPAGTVSFSDSGSGDPFSTCTLTQGANPLGTVTCTVTVTAAAPAGAHTINASFAATDSVHANSTTTSSATLTVVTPPSITKVFGAVSIPVNGTTTLSFTITNPAANTVSLTGVSFTDILPGGLVVASPSALTGSCGSGTITAGAGTSTVALSGATLATSGSCTFSVNVTSSMAGSYVNSVQVTSTNGGTGNTSQATLTIVAPPAITKAFGAASIPVSGTTTLSFTLTNPNTGTDLTGVAFNDTLTGGLQIASTPGVVNTCAAGSVIAMAGSTSVSLSGGTIAKGTNCTITVNVTGTTVGTVTNTTGAISSANGGTGGTSNMATLTVNPDATTTALVCAVGGPTSMTCVSVFGQTVTFTATVTNASLASGPAPVGTVQFYLGGSPLGGPVSASGSSGNASTFQISVNNVNAAAMAYSITAAYTPGNGNFTASSTDGKNGDSGAVSLMVTPLPVSSTASVSPDTQQYSDTVQFTASINNGQAGGQNPIVGGMTMVSFQIGGTTMANCTIAGVPNSSPTPFSCTLPSGQFSSAQPFTLTQPYPSSGTADGSCTLQGDGLTVSCTTPNVPLLEPSHPAAGSPSAGDLQPSPTAKSVTAVITNLNPNFTTTNPTASLTINVEDARAFYAAPSFVATANVTTFSAVVHLKANVFDISNSQFASGGSNADAAYDTNPGDIQNATVQFVQCNDATCTTNTPIGSPATVSLADPSASPLDYTTGVAAFDWNVTLSCSIAPCSQTFTVGMVVGDYYTNQTVFTQAKYLGTVTVATPIPTALMVSSPSAHYGDPNVTLTATLVTKGTTTPITSPAETITFLFNGNPYMATTSGGVASVTVPTATLTVNGSPYPFTASFGGDSSAQPPLTAASDAKGNVTILADTTSISTANAMANYGDANVTLTATVYNKTNGAPVNEGAVSFMVMNGMTQIGSSVPGTLQSSSTGKGTFTASFPLSAVNQGTYNITATYSDSSTGDFLMSATDDSNGGKAGSLTVNPDVTAVNTTSISAQYGDPAGVTLSATVSNKTNSAPVNEGTVTFTVKQGGTPIGSPVVVTASGANNGVFTGNFPLPLTVNAGSYLIYASYSDPPKNNFNGSATADSNGGTAGTLMVTLDQPAFTALTASQMIYYGTPTIGLSGTISAPAGSATLYPPVGEKITITIGSASQMVSIGSNGIFSTTNFPTTGLSASSYPIQYSYGGNTNFKTASDFSTSLTVNPAPTTTTIGSSLNQSAIPARVTLAAIVTNNATPAIPVGTVTFIDTSNGNASLGTQAVPGGSAVTALLLGVGTHVIQAVYTPSSPPMNFALSSSSVTSPVVTITGPPSGAVQAVGTPFSFSANFTDSNTSSPSAQWAFDATTGTPGTFSGSTITGAYTFPAAGVFGVTLTFNDGLGGIVVTNTVSAPGAPPNLMAQVVVYDPSGGFVTGGGWINSPAGAYTPNPSLSGKATFGFVSKYLKGATVPTGETEFNFQVASFDFHSTVYQWLVVSGSQAQYKGTGPINGAGNYNFLLTASDGSPDGFRIKITDPATNAVIYDNLPAATDSVGNTQNIGGGSIVIHK